MAHLLRREFAHVLHHVSARGVKRVVLLNRIAADGNLDINELAKCNLFVNPGAHLKD